MLQAYHQELATILLNYHIDRIVLGSMSVGVSLWMFGVVSVFQTSTATRIPPQPATPKLQHIETRTHNQCGDTIEKSQAADNGCINVRNMLSIEEVK